MTTVPKRLGVKFSLTHEPKAKPDDILPIFQRWIQEHSVDGMLIDVIDYKHVPDGPGILLIADEADFAYDLGDGQIGLHYIRKRALPDDLSSALRLTFYRALQAARALEAEAPGDIVFDYSLAKITFLDRKHYRNDPQVFEDISANLAEILGELYGAAVEVSRLYEDPRRLFAVQCRVQTDDINVDALILRLQEFQQTA